MRMVDHGSHCGQGMLFIDGANRILVGVTTEVPELGSRVLTV